MTIWRTLGASVRPADSLKYSDYSLPYSAASGSSDGTRLVGQAPSRRRRPTKGGPAHRGLVPSGLSTESSGPVAGGSVVAVLESSPLGQRTSTSRQPSRGADPARLTAPPGSVKVRNVALPHPTARADRDDRGSSTWQARSTCCPRRCLDPLAASTMPAQSPPLRSSCTS
jgi:hypothetical protein